MEQINKMSKMCNAKVRFTWPGFSEAAEGKCSKLRKKDKKKKKKKEESEKECEKGGEEEGEKPTSPPRADKDAQQEESKEDKKKKKLECEACTRGGGRGRGRGHATRAVLWCCTRCTLMFCGAMRLFVAAAGVLGLCLTVFFIFAPSEDRKP